jgi:hypothetical protein
VGDRWQRSVYLESTPRVVTSHSEFRPVGQTAARTPDFGALDSLLFVVDTTNTKPGKSGWVMVGDVKLEK